MKLALLITSATLAVVAITYIVLAIRDAIDIALEIAHRNEENVDNEEK